MQLSFDAETGRLQLDRAMFDEAVAVAGQQNRPAGASVAALQETGVINGGRPHPTLVPGFAAVLEPVCRLQVSCRGGQDVEESHEGWVAPQTAALLLDAGNGVREFVVVQPDFVPAAIARIVRLGPRPTAPGETLTNGHAQVGASHGWKVTATWTGPNGAALERTIEVVDTEAGLLLVEPSDAPGTPVPTRPRTIWRLLSLLLPGDDEVAWHSRN